MAANLFHNWTLLISSAYFLLRLLSFSPGFLLQIQQRMKFTVTEVRIEHWNMSFMSTCHLWLESVPPKRPFSNISLCFTTTCHKWSDVLRPSTVSLFVNNWEITRFPSVGSTFSSTFSFQTNILYCRRWTIQWYISYAISISVCVKWNIDSHIITGIIM